AQGLLERVVAGAPPERTALHVCRGNWTRDESVALSGGYEPLLPFFAGLRVGTLMLEHCTPRAGELEALKALPERFRVGIGVVNQKQERIEPQEEVEARVRAAIDLLGRERVWLTPDCGFATFADNPLASARIAERKLRAIADAVAAVTGS